MSAAERFPRAAAVIIAASTLACASLPAPRHWVPQPENMPTDVRGSWANVRYYTAGHERVVASGELLGVRSDSLFIATTDLRVMPFAWNDIDRVQVVSFDPHEGACYAAGAGGAAATLSHGWFSVFTFPVWLVIGATTGAGRVGEAVLTYPNETDEWRDLLPYARFPAGIPPGFRPSRGPSEVAPEPVLAIQTRPPTPDYPSAPVPRYQPPEKAGNGIVFGGGFFEQGKGAWTASYHLRLHRELFALGGYTRFDDDVLDMSQWWAGLRLGDPFFFGAKYIYTYHSEVIYEPSGPVDNSGHGVGIFGGFLTPTSEHVGVGAMAGYDFTGLELEFKDEFWWATVLLELTLFPAR